MLHRDDSLLNVLHFVLRSTLLHYAQQKTHPSITSPITSHHPLPYIHTHVQKPHDPICQEYHVVVPCVAVFPTRSICLRYRVGGAQWGVAPAPSTLPGEKEAKHNTQGTQTQSTTLPGQCTYTGTQPCQLSAKGGSSAPLPTVFSLVCFSASVLLFGCLLK